MVLALFWVAEGANLEDCTQGNEVMSPVYLHTKSAGAIEKLLGALRGCDGIKHAHTNEVYALFILRVEAPHKHLGAVRFQNDGDAMKLVMPGMKNVSCHGRSDRYAAVFIEGRSETFRDCGGRPSLDHMTMDHVDRFTIPKERK